MRKSIRTIMAFLTAMTVVTGAMSTTAFAEEAVDDSAAVITSEDTGIEEVLEKRGAEMIQYLLDYDITEDVAEEITGYYLEGLRKRIERGTASPEGIDGKKTNEYYTGLCLRAATIQIELSELDKAPSNQVSEYLAENDIVGDENRKMTEIYLDGAKKILADSDFRFSDDSVEAELTEEKTTEKKEIAEEEIEYEVNGDDVKVSVENDETNNTPEIEDNKYNEVLAVKGEEMTKYLLDNGISEDVAKEIAGYYTEGLEVRLACGWANSDGTEINVQTTEYYHDTCLRAASIQMILSGIDVDYEPAHEVIEFLKVVHDTENPYENVEKYLDGTKKGLAAGNYTIHDTDLEEATLPESDSSQDKVSIKEDIQAGTAAAETTLRGDADLSGALGLADAIVVSKFNLNSKIYPLANTTAMANADMNGDGAVDSNDLSMIIEANLGN